MTMHLTTLLLDWQPLPVPAALLGESPVWHHAEQALYWTDIPGRALHRWHPQRAEHRSWPMPAEVGCLAICTSGGLMLAMRTGIARFDPALSEAPAEVLLTPPYDPALERFNDGKVDPQGRLWVGTIYEPRDRPAASLLLLDRRGLTRLAGDCTVSNGLAWSPDHRWAYWSDTFGHRLSRIPLGPDGLPRGPAEVIHRCAPKPAADDPLQALRDYGGRPDGAAVDAEGCYWSAMFEGQRLVRFSPEGEPLAAYPLPVRCPTMPCFGGADRRTLYLTTARHQRPERELAEQPLAGMVLSCRVDVPGLPVAELDDANLPDVLTR